MKVILVKFRLNIDKTCQIGDQEFSIGSELLGVKEYFV